MGYYYVDNFADMIIFFRREYPSKRAIEELLRDLFGEYFRQRRIHKKLQAPIEEFRKIKREKKRITQKDADEVAKKFRMKSSSARLIAKMVVRGVFQRGFN